MISRLFVANRGEIACRIFRTCREMGIGTTAAFTPADAGSLHARSADLAISVSSYLSIEVLVRAALEAGADAVHPGYGFLSENVDFARAVIDAGLTWIGPPPSAIEAMGSKIAAKQLMAGAGVPVLSSSSTDFPLVIKPSAGGGGRGMRVVRSPSDLEQALAQARSEAASAFGDPAVFCEPYLSHVRHIEVQVMADHHGCVWTLGERECSLQRRHQKVLEETPSPFVSTALREALCEAARSAALAVGYAGAGTVEFLVDGDGRFFFLEMNTRLQVEHPVTECVTGLDLVRLQLAVACGERLGEPPSLAGHAIEVRLYAEDPAQGWLPQSGTLHRFEIPPGVRVDPAVESGSHVGIHYDPMLAKLIAWAPTRAEAAARLAESLAGAGIHGLRTNRDLLVRILRHPAFLAGHTTTAFLTHPAAQDAASGGVRSAGAAVGGFLDELLRPLADEEAVRLSAVAAARAQAAANRAEAKVLRGLPSGWRNVRSAPRRRFGVEYEPHQDDAPDRVVLDVGNVRYTFHVAIYEDTVEVDSVLGPVTLQRIPRFPPPSPELPKGSLVAPMPGTVVRLAVQVGDAVESGQPLLWLEAMKMEHQITAPTRGVVTAINVTLHQQVDVGAVLIVVEEQEQP